MWGNIIGVNFNIALEALWANRMRSLLTALGIFIGVAAVIAALTLTQGAGASINARFSRFGPTTITVRNGAANTRGAFGAGGTVQSLTPADASAIRQQVAHVAYISPVVSTSEQVIYGGQNLNTSVQGVSPDYQTIQDWTLTEGLWFSTTDQTAGKPVAILGQTVVLNLFPTGTDPINQTIRIGNQLFRVIGVLQAKGSGSSSSADDVIYIPYTTALDRLKSSPYVDHILVAADDPNNVNQVQQDLTTLLEQRHHRSFLDARLMSSHGGRLADMPPACRAQALRVPGGKKAARRPEPRAAHVLIGAWPDCALLKVLRHTLEAG